MKTLTKSMRREVQRYDGEVDDTEIRCAVHLCRRVGMRTLRTVDLIIPSDYCRPLRPSPSEALSKN